MTKFDNPPNPYNKADEEAKKKGNASTPNKFTMDIPQGKETKKQMSLMFTQSHKDKARRIAKKHNLSVSELFGHWLDQYEE
ncbi:hypothetical protein [Bacillus cereus group sp. MYBK242-2]|uniref:hypothetical protein n=1 Tax=Bacillus cereus group sp. MYBK242-2 TaxID=3450647 RepID=UPI003F79426C